MSFLPPVRSRHSVRIICEGYEDYHWIAEIRKAFSSNE